MTTTEIRLRLDDRYGRRPTRLRRALWVIGAVVAVALVGYLSWGTVSRAMASVDADTTGFEVVDAHSVTVAFQVTAQPNTAFACAIEAQDTEHGVVGWRVVEYAADPAHTRTFRETLPTVAEATTGLVRSCWIP